jgi:hypothetical protein
MIDLLTIVVLPAVLFTGAVWAADQVARRVRRWLRSRRRQRRALLDREIADALAPFGADISVWPSRAPRNGTTHETAD